jgi:hypothetical protein
MRAVCPAQMLYVPVTRSLFEVWNCRANTCAAGWWYPVPSPQVLSTALVPRLEQAATQCEACPFYPRGDLLHAAAALGRQSFVSLATDLDTRANCPLRDALCPRATSMRCVARRRAEALTRRRGGAVAFAMALETVALARAAGSGQAAAAPHASCRLAAPPPPARARGFRRQARDLARPQLRDGGLALHGRGERHHARGLHPRRAVHLRLFNPRARAPLRRAARGPLG